MEWKDRTYCGDLTASHVGREVLLMGWVDAVRDHGNLLFIHLRDIRGLVQVVFDPKADMASYQTACTLREEYVVRVKGSVFQRAKGSENPYLETGEIEVFAKDLTILAQSRTLPFLISEKAMVFGEDIQAGPENVDEDLRLQYRYLDLRRPSRQNLFKMRYEIMKCIRDYLDQLSFIEVETPFLTRSTPEGARDYLVPSRLHEGKFYSLKKQDDPYTVEIDRAVDLIREKREREKNRIVKTFSEDSDLMVMNGRWGKYLKHMRYSLHFLSSLPIN